MAVTRKRAAAGRGRRPQPDAAYRVAAVERALALLMQVAETPGRGLSDLARLSGNTKARTYRFLQTLEQAGFVLCRDDTPHYWLGYQALRLGSQAHAQLDLPRIAQPVVERIGERSDETVQIRIRHGMNSICVSRWETARIIRYHAELGRPVPLHIGSSKLLLAFAPKELQQAVLAGRLEALTPLSFASPERLAAQLARVRRNGFCISRGEMAPEALSVGYPVRAPSGEVVAAFIIAAPAARISRARLKELAALAMQGAQELQAALGARQPRPAEPR